MVIIITIWRIIRTYNGRWFSKVQTRSVSFKSLQTNCVRVPNGLILNSHSGEEEQAEENGGKKAEDAVGEQEEE